MDHETGRAYGSYLGDDHDFKDFARRLTFLIDPAGVVRKVYDVKDVSTHSEAVLADILHH